MLAVHLECKNIPGCDPRVSLTRSPFNLLYQTIGCSREQFVEYPQNFIKHYSDCDFSTSLKCHDLHHWWAKLRRYIWYSFSARDGEDERAHATAGSFIGTCLGGACNNRNCWGNSNADRYWERQEYSPFGRWTIHKGQWLNLWPICSEKTQCFYWRSWYHINVVISRIGSFEAFIIFLWFEGSWKPRSLDLVILESFQQGRRVYNGH